MPRTRRTRRSSSRRRSVPQWSCSRDRAGTEAGDETMKIFDVIDKLMASLPLTPEKVAKVLDTRIVRDKESDTAAIAAYVQPETVKGGPYESVDLRMPD